MVSGMRAWRACGSYAGVVQRQPGVSDGLHASLCGGAAGEQLVLLEVYRLRMGEIESIARPLRVAYAAIDASIAL